MMFENDPFWVWTRRIIGISFWVILVAMLVGSVAVMANAPNCLPFNNTMVHNYTSNLTYYIGNQ